MPIASLKILNRVSILNLATPIDNLSANAIDLKIDPSQQYNFYGVHWGYNFSFADQANMQQGLLLGILDFRFSLSDPAAPFIGASLNTLGEIFYLSNMNTRSDKTFSIEDLSSPIIINGDRRVTFLQFLPVIQGGFTTAVLDMFLEVRGEITQLQDQDKPRLGNWQIR
jgi:hypothetical protein